MNLTDQAGSAHRPANLAAVVEVVHRRGWASRSEIATETGLSRTTISSIIDHLLHTRWLREIDLPVASAVGRPSISFALARRAGLVAGLSFGGDQLRAIITDYSGDVIEEDVWSCDFEASSDTALDTAVTAVRALTDRVGDGEPLRQIGLGVPAPIRATTGAVMSGSIFPGWSRRRPALELAQRCGVPTVIDNDANLGALGEHRFGVARGYSDIIYIETSSGAGAGLILAGRLYRGSVGVAGEIGHVTVDTAGAYCHCGRRGCLETEAAPKAILGTIASIPLRGRPTPTSISDISRLLDHDPAVRRVVTDAGHTIGRSLAPLANALNPALFVVGGTLAQLGEPLVGAVRETLQGIAQPGLTHHFQVLKGALEDRAAAMGAVALALESVPHPDVTR